MREIETRRAGGARAQGLSTVRAIVASIVLAFNVTVIVPVRAVGTSSTVTLNVPELPDSVTLGGQVSPWPVHATVAVTGAGTAAVRATVIVTGAGPIADVAAGLTVRTVGGFTVNVADRVCPPDVAETVTVRLLGTTWVGI